MEAAPAAPVAPDARGDLNAENKLRRGRCAPRPAGRRPTAASAALDGVWLRPGCRWRVSRCSLVFPCFANLDYGRNKHILCI